MAEPEKLQLEAYVGPALRAVMLKQVASATRNLQRSWEEAQDEHYRLQLLADELGEPMTDSRWTQERERLYQQFAVMANKLIEYGDEGQSGRRDLAWDSDDQDTVILGKEGDPTISLDPSGALVMRQGETSTVIQPAGLHPALIAGIVVVAAVTVIAGGAIYADAYKASLRGAQQGRIKEVYDDQVKGGVPPAEAAKNAAKFGAAIADATRPSDKPTGTLARVAEVAETGMYTLVALGLLGLGGYAIIRFFPIPKRGAASATT